MESIFRPASEKDAEEIFNLFETAVRRLQTQRIDQWDDTYPDRRLLGEDIAGRQMYILTRGGRITAAVVLNEEQDGVYGGADWTDRDGRVAVIHRLCVHPDFQGMGVGRQTVLAAENHLKGAGYTSIRLDAFKKNAASLRLYDRMGYSPAGHAVLHKREFVLYEKLLGRTRNINQADADTSAVMCFPENMGTTGD
ncbi:Protein N-acetyltransferase, RimJ/RimL family [Sporobacter termitidis DSM 10068]|uniref:Protein N-acetyltransferase, RimJ/RimL family n=1 Tax=Sporobacter termitidis DSM 10068 TaxID=1123282 RepID=A0A1M5ZA23_9FIRM|nr:GNAT family N-acetyltransferase [Sporobacter termitidis]SHI21074.1 Protein N-acetyltransferase, RimJ/RimL family [Sporobacter termitidis DSM 10068]